MNRKLTSKHSRQCRQNGAVLVVSLMLLLIMTLISVTSLRTTSMDEKMASNTRQRQIAFQASEAALRSAEVWLVATINNRSDIRANFAGTSGTAGRYSALASLDSSLAPASWDVAVDGNWSTANSAEVRTIPMLNAKFAVNTTPGAPRYRIEYIGRIGNPPLNYFDPDLREYAFQIIAIGWGIETNARYLLSSTFHMQL